MSQNQNDQQEERLIIPRRALIIKLLIAGLAIFWLAVLVGRSDFGCSPIQPQSRTQSRRNQVLPYQPVKSEIVRQADGSWLIKWTGEGENGFRLPDLPAGGYSLTWLRGKIVYSANGDSFPIWGADVYYTSNLRYYYLKDKGIRPHQVVLILGEIGSGQERLFPFRPGKTQIRFRTDGRPLFLFYHYLRGKYDQFGWDGSYVVFRLERLD